MPPMTRHEATIDTIMKTIPNDGICLSMELCGQRRDVVRQCDQPRKTRHIPACRIGTGKLARMRYDRYAKLFRNLAWTADPEAILASDDATMHAGDVSEADVALAGRSAVCAGQNVAPPVGFLELAQRNRGIPGRDKPIERPFAEADHHG